MILCKIIFWYEKGVIGVFGGWVKMCEFCVYDFWSLKVYKQKNCVRTVYYTLIMSELAPSSDVSQNPYRIIFDFWISVKFLIQKNCYNSRTTNDIDIKLGPVTKPEFTQNSSKKCWRWFSLRTLWLHCHFSDLWLIWRNLEARFRTHSL